MTALKLRAALPPEDRTGITNPDGLITAIVLLEPCQETRDLDTDRVTVVLRVDRIEQVTGRDARTATQLMHQAYEDRTGKRALALVDPTTGEVA